MAIVEIRYFLLVFLLSSVSLSFLFLLVSAVAFRLLSVAAASLVPPERVLGIILPPQLVLQL